MTEPNDVVFLLHHVREFDDGLEDVKLIGVYKTLGDAEAALERVRYMPGFRRYPEGFEINEAKLGQDGWTEGFVAVYPNGTDDADEDIH